MFDADDVIVARETKGAYDLLPYESIVAPADGAEKPGAIGHVTITFCVEDAVARDIRRIERGILCVHVKNAVAESANGDRDIGSLPEKMAGIEIHADIFARGFAQAESGLNVVNDEAGMRFDGHFDSVVGGKLTCFLPVGKNFFVPLPFECFEKFRGPGGDDPIGTLGVVAVAGTTGKSDYDGNLEFFGKLYRFAKCFVVFASQVAIGVHGIAVTGKSADGEARIANLGAKIIQLMRIGEQGIDFDVVTARPAASGELYRADSGERT